LNFIYSFEINIFFNVLRTFYCVEVKNNILKIKKYYFNIFQNKKYFKKNYNYFSKIHICISISLAFNADAFQAA